jgi:hypothetical protein
MSKTSNSAKIDCLVAWIEDLKSNPKNKARKNLTSVEPALNAKQTVFVRDNTFRPYKKR